MADDVRIDAQIGEMLTMKIGPESDLAERVEDLESDVQLLADQLADLVNEMRARP